MKLSIVIPVCNQLAYTEMCLDSLAIQTYAPFETIVVDNGSTDGTYERLCSRPEVIAIHNTTNLGFAPAVNLGIAVATGENVLVLNNDTIVPSYAIVRLLAALEANPDFGIIGAVSNRCAPFQSVFVPYTESDPFTIEAFANDRWLQRGAAIRETHMVIGLAMLLRRSTIERIGVFDEQFKIGNFEDNDLCMRAALANIRVGVADGVFIHHFGSRTFLGEGFNYAAIMAENEARFREKWKGHIR
jgi:GT2 family glycosyltransferase